MNLKCDLLLIIVIGRSTFVELEPPRCTQRGDKDSLGLMVKCLQV